MGLSLFLTDLREKDSEFKNSLFPNLGNTLKSLGTEKWLKILIKTRNLKIIVMNPYDTSLRLLLYQGFRLNYP